MREKVLGKKRYVESRCGKPGRPRNAWQACLAAASRAPHQPDIAAVVTARFSTYHGRRTGRRMPVVYLPDAAVLIASRHATSCCAGSAK